MLHRLPLIAVFAALLVSPVFGQTPLFEKKNLAEWDFYVDKEGVAVGDVFTMSDDGVLGCKGIPFGYLCTKESFKNFKLSVDWCWPEGVKPTNSGIFLKIGEQPQGTFLPQVVEVQLAHKSAGDLWGFHGRKLSGPADRFVDRTGEKIGKTNGVKRILDMEKEPGQWNSMDILCENGLIVVAVNGKIVNWTTGAEPIEGRVGFQSEGGPIQFKNAVLTVLP